MGLLNSFVCKDKAGASDLRWRGWGGVGLGWLCVSRWLGGGDEGVHM